MRAAFSSIMVMICVLVLSSCSPHPIISRQTAHSEEQHASQSSSLRVRRYVLRLIARNGSRPCEIRFEKNNQPFFTKIIPTAANIQSTFVSTTDTQKPHSEPDAMVECELTNGDYETLIFEAANSVRLTNLVKSGHAPIKFEDAHGDSPFAILFDLPFDEFGGATQIIIPVKIFWNGKKFRLTNIEKMSGAERAKIKEQAREMKRLFWNIDPTSLYVPPELTEAVVRLYCEGRPRDAKTLFDLSCPSSYHAKTRSWNLLRNTVDSKLIDFR
jgi:hypothetical protein